MKVVLITGGSRGIGRSMVRKFAVIGSRNNTSTVSCYFTDYTVTNMANYCFFIFYGNDK